MKHLYKILKRIISIYKTLITLSIKKSDAKLTLIFYKLLYWNGSNIRNDDSDNDEQVLEKIRELNISVADITHLICLNMRNLKVSMGQMF